MSDLMSWLATPASVVGSFLGVRSANKANRSIAREQMGFQSQMSGTAYQRAMADMRAAGLNPILAYQQGGASSPAGSSLPAQDELTPGINAAMNSARAVADIKNLKEMNKKIRSDALLNHALMHSAIADARLKTSSAKVADVNSRLLDAQIPAAETTAGLEKTVAGKILRYFDRLTSSAKGFTSIFK